MLLPLPELVFTLSYILVQGGRLHVKAENIMLSKLTRQSSTNYYTYRSNSRQYTHFYNSYNANDGSKSGYTARTNYQAHPFWQGDLQGFYTVHNISVTSDGAYGHELTGAYIGVSSVDVDCPDDDVTWCGHWPAEALYQVTLTFNCSQVEPMRFVRVWRNVTGHLAVQEVEVQGTPRRTNAAKYEKTLNRKLSTPTTAVKAISANDCGLKCHVTQPCLGFSYNPSADPACLLTTSTATTAATGWVNYFVSTCSLNITCDLTDQFK